MYCLRANRISAAICKYLQNILLSRIFLSQLYHPCGPIFYYSTRKLFDLCEWCPQSVLFAYIHNASAVLSAFICSREASVFFVLVFRLATVTCENIDCFFLYLCGRPFKPFWPFAFFSCFDNSHPWELTQRFRVIDAPLYFCFISDRLWRADPVTP